MTCTSARSLLLALAAFTTTTAPVRAGDQEFASRVVAAGLEEPCHVISAPGDASRLFILEMPGRIRILDRESGEVLPVPFLDIDPLVRDQFVGLAFDPAYDTTGHFYCFYLNVDLQTEIRRFTVSADPNVADPASGHRIIITQQPVGSHNGGWIGFGPDGYLYLPLGDGAFEVAPTGRSQDPTTLLGKLVRIDVLGDDFPEDPDRNYAIPPTNPFVGLEPLDEIWAFGLRNPFRSSFDRATGDLYIGDVGQHDWEEVIWHPATMDGGVNYGWPCMEGMECSEFGYCDCDDPAMMLPLLAYPHAGPRAVMGGYVYRGKRFPARDGWYCFGDYASAQVWMASHDAGSNVVIEEITDQISPAVDGTPITAIVSFGEGAEGELFVVSHEGSIFEIIAGTTDTSADLDGDGTVGVSDLLILLAAWGPCPAGEPCPADLDLSGDVGVGDLLAMLSAWGTGG